jgi:3-deoxy-manno-octulosonate cytidylyltransferase (CMP-KDO synthetase)
MKKVIIIPARYGSSRYKGKPLVKILNREMVLRVADICSEVVNRKDLYIATDNNKISKVVKKAKYKVLMTSSKCLTGTDRVAEAAKKIKSKIYVNVQGDEPTINPNDIKKIINAKIKYPNHVICGYDKVHSYENPSSVNLPKVVVNQKKELIYMSRSLVPGNKKKVKNLSYFKQVCIYAFNKKELSKFYLKKKKGQVEEAEDIEILRFFDLDIKIKMIKLNSSSVAVDEFKDVRKAEKILKKRLPDVRKR